MSALAEDSTQPVSARAWALRIIASAVVIAVVAAAGLWLKSLSSQPQARERQVARIAVLPDTPPPPPPPPPEKPPDNKQTPKPTPQAEAPKPAAVAEKPADAPLKMEGPAGDGPSAFQAGAVSREYQAGPTAPAAAVVAAPAATRSQQRLYATSARQQLRDELERHYTGDATTLVAELRMWVAADGALQRLEVQPTGNAQYDSELRAAVELTQKNLRLPPPPPMEQPLRFRLSLGTAS